MIGSIDMIFLQLYYMGYFSDVHSPAWYEAIQWCWCRRWFNIVK